MTRMRSSLLGGVGQYRSDLPCTDLPVGPFSHQREGEETAKVYWRFISGFGPIGSNLGHLAQIGQYRQMAQSRINTGDCASR